MAGQIGLDPPIMRLVEGVPFGATSRKQSGICVLKLALIWPGGPRQEALRCLKSCAAVAVALKSDFSLGLLWCTLYASQAAGLVAAQALDEAFNDWMQVHPATAMDIALRCLYPLVLHRHQLLGVCVTGTINSAPGRR